VLCVVKVNVAGDGECVVKDRLLEEEEDAEVVGEANWAAMEEEAEAEEEAALKGVVADEDAEETVEDRAECADEVEEGARSAGGEFAEAAAVVAAEAVLCAFDGTADAGEEYTTEDTSEDGIPLVRRSSWRRRARRRARSWLRVGEGRAEEGMPMLDTEQARRCRSWHHCQPKSARRPARSSPALQRLRPRNTSTTRGS
jgi:hypothetical protein